MSKKLFIKKVFSISIVIMISMLLLSVKEEAKTQYDSLTFDAEYYINVYPDIKNAFGNDYQSAYNHFMTFGIKEGRKGSPYFDVYYYLNQNSDLQKAFGNNYELAYNHFISSGINENRAGSPYIDPAYYAKKYSDIKNAYGNDYRGIYYHFYTNGIKEGRKGNIYFDVEYYLTKNADLEKALGKGNYEAAFNHFLYNGIGELREASSDVNIKCYLESNKDLQSAYGNNKNYIGLFEHCYINGIKDKRLLNHTIVNMEEVSPTCISKGQTGGKKCKYCGEIVESPKILNESNHNWQKPEITWNGLNATAKVVCSNCNKVENIEVTVDDGVITKEATCIEDGIKTYTATATYNGKTTTSTVTESIPVTGKHSPENKAIFSWGNDNKTATAKFKCEKCGIELEAKVEVDDGVITKKANCSEEGEKTYTATARYDEKIDTDTKIIKLPMNENKHDWKASFKWDPHHTSAVANFVCIHNKNHIKEGIQAEITSSEKPATCTENGEKTYTATVELDGEKYTESKVDETKSIGHKWSEPKFTWSGINKNGVITGKEITATAEIVCENDNTHKIKKSGKDVKITKEVKENKQDETKTNIYTAEVVFSEIRQEPFKDIISEATAGMEHDFGEPEFEWAEDLTATAKFTCKNNSSHIDVVNATVIPEVTKRATCTENGITTYRASVNFNGKTYTCKETKTKNEPVKTGHDWNMPVFKWTGIDEENHIVTGDVKAIATFKCNNGCGEVQNIETTVTSNKVEPTCIKEGVTTYTATANYNGVSSSESKKITVPAKGHTWETQDTAEGFKRKCTVCGTIDEETTQLETKFVVTKCNEIEDLTQKFEYQNVSGETWTLNSLSSNSKGKIKGKIKEQEIKENKDNGNKIKGYYVGLTVTINGLDKIPSSASSTPSITVSGAKDNKYYIVNGSDEKTFKVLLQLDRKECSKNCTGNNCNCLSCDCGKLITISVDADGTNGGYTASKYTIDYCNAEFRKDINVTFKYKNENDELISKEFKVEDGKVTVPSELQSTTNFGNKYHKFLYWCDENGNKKFNENTSINEINEDTTFNSVYQLDFDSFVQDVVTDLDSESDNYSKDFSAYFDVKKSGNNVTFIVKNIDTKLSELKETSIPGAIAYVLNKGEVKNITLATGGKNVEFTANGASNESETIRLANLSDLKTKVANGAQKLFQNVLGVKVEETMTLQDMYLQNKTFTISVGDLDNKTKLVEGANKTYTFNFKSDITSVTVTDQEKLEKALNQGYKTIIIGENFTVNKDIEISKEVTITGNNNYKVTRSGDSGSIFKVKENGNLILTNIQLSGGDSGITVENGGNLTATGLNYEDEKYLKPAVKAEKNRTSVNLTDTNGKQANKITKEKVTKYEDISGDKSKIYGDKKEDDTSYNYYNYYCQEKNSKIYSIGFNSYESGVRVIFTRLVYAGEKATEPYKEDPFSIFSEFISNGYEFKILGYAKSNVSSVIPSSLENHTCNIPEDRKTEIKKIEDWGEVYSDYTYYSIYCKHLKANTVIVKDNNEFKQAISNSNISEIRFANENVEIDLSNEEININRNLSIYGFSDRNRTKIKVKKINVNNCSNLHLNRLTIEGVETTDNLINVTVGNTQSKISIWQSPISSTAQVTNAIKISGTGEVSVDISWSSFSGNIQNSLDIETVLADNSSIYGNTFKTNNDENSKYNDIIIKEFANNSTKTRIQSNTFNSKNNSILILKDASGKTAQIKCTDNSNVNINVKYDDTHKDFKNITLIKKSSNEIAITYTKDSEVTQEITEDGKIKITDETN